MGVTARLASREDYARNIEPVSSLQSFKLPKLGSLKTYLHHTPQKNTAAIQLLCGLLETRIRSDS
jgi:hypothetical protein